MILKISNNSIVNWDNVISILTRDLNIHDTEIVGEEYSIEIHRGDNGYTEYPFAISVETFGRYYTIYRTDSAEEMQEVYNAILERIIAELNMHSNMCDISGLVKNHDLYKKRVTVEEYKEIEDDKMRKMKIEMQEVRADG